MNETNGRTWVHWMLWGFIVVAIPAAYLIVREPVVTSTKPDIPLEVDVTSVTTVSRENSEHELHSLARELEQNPDHAPVLLRMAQLARDLGRTDEAVGYLTAAIDAEPDDGEARLELGRVLYESGNVQGAIDRTLQVLELDPRNVGALYNLGAIYGNLLDEPHAREYWKRAVAIDPNSESGRLAARGLSQLESD